MSATTTKPSQHAKGEGTPGSDAGDHAAQNRYTAANVADLYATPFAHGFNSTQRLAAIRAVLRHGAHQDGAHYHTRTQGGLHPAYVAFNAVEKTGLNVFEKFELVESSLGDVFDSITMQDRLDGGLSLLLRCPGFGSSEKLTPNKATVDVYITPRELIRNERISGDTSMIVQAFCEEFVIPHVERFGERCRLESIQPPKPRELAEAIELEGPHHLPVYQNPLSCRIQCTALSNIEKMNLANDTRHLSSSVAIRESIMLTPSAKMKQPAPKTPSALSAKNDPAEINSVSSLRQRFTRQRRPADAFLYTAKFPEPIPLVLPSETLQPKGTALISIGPSSDAVLDRFNLGDDLLPSLHTLVTKFRSSRWESALRSSPWNLSSEQASNLASALAADLKGREFSVMAKPKMSWLSVIIRLLGIAILVCILCILALLIYAYY